MLPVDRLVYEEGFGNTKTYTSGEEDFVSQKYSYDGGEGDYVSRIREGVANEIDKRSTALV